MPLSPEWSDLLLRLLCTLAAGALIGFDRGEHGRAAGLRTTLLVSLAACLAMIQTNLLLNSTGKAPNSFVVMDVMRLPLGILSGMGFIGAGAIVRRDSAVLGVTTAATLWFATVLGLCFGGGQYGVGGAGLVCGVLVITGLRPLEARLKREHRATLVVVTTVHGPDAESLRATLERQHYKINSCGIVRNAGGEKRKLTCHVTWRARQDDTATPQLIESLSSNPEVLQFSWKPV
ncbi:MAG TPA: MgtC/SapB family protein [Bryobacteraceae bacterium]|jgi:putative Mg2+ transporter-C (MgtC) family protein